MSVSLAMQGELELAENYGICFATSLYVYDYLLTFHQEVEFIWRSELSYGTALFIFIRYTAFLNLAGYLFIGFGNPVSQLSCRVVAEVLECSTVIVMFCAGLILALRTWAIWNRSWICGGILAVAWLTMVALVLVFDIPAAIRLLTDPDAAFPGLAGCALTSTPTTAPGVTRMFSSLAVYEGLIFILTAIRGLNYLYMPSPLILILYRDAFLASTCLLALTVLDSSLSSTDSTQFYIPYLLSVAFYSIAPCRIMLNLRETAMHVDEEISQL